MSATIAVADIGGTNARFALAEIADGKVVSLGKVVTLHTDDHSSFQEAYKEFGRRLGHDLPADLAISFAGPVGGEVMTLTNSPWEIRPALLTEQLGVARLRIVNDFGAIGYAVSALGDDQFAHVRGPEGPLPHRGLTTIVGPGTGLGVAQLLRTAHGNHVIETEGGHIDFAPLDPIEDQILEHLRRQLGRVSVERIVAGSGLPNIYAALSAVAGKSVVDGDEVALWKSAIDGSDPTAVAAIDRFFLSLGAVAGDLALAHGANAVVLAGGLGFRLRDKFATSGFADRFAAKGRFRRRMEAIPVKIVVHPQPGLFGAAVAFAQDYG